MYTMTCIACDCAVWNQACEHALHVVAYMHGLSWHVRKYASSHCVCEHYLGFSGQNPAKEAFYVGFDVLGVLAPGDDCDTTLHVPLQADLQSKFVN